jgi:hypothetical protein
VTWKFWTKKPTKVKKVVTHIKAIPVSTLYRWYCYDIGVENLSKLDDALGLVPISEDAADMELEDSEMRLYEIASLLPFLDAMANINATVFSETHVKQMLKSNPDFDSLDPKMLVKATESMLSMYQYVSISALVSAFSSATQLGLIVPANVDIEECVSSDDLDLGLL